MRIGFNQPLPSMRAPMMLQCMLIVAGATIIEVGLRALGLGMTTLTPAWENMMRAGWSFIGVAPWISMFPATAIIITATGLYLLRNGLRSPFPQVDDYKSAKL